MKASDLKGLTVQQIRDKYAIDLTNPMTSVSFVNVPAVTKLYAGKANGLFGFQGEGFQFYIDKLQFTSFDEIEAWFSKPISVDEFLKN